jgi:murein L,D-transpeptidase YcbB/YkuD
LLLTAAALVTLAGCQPADTASSNQAPPAIDAQALRAAADDEVARRFYEARDWRPAWSQEGGAALERALADAPRHGLDPATWLDPIRAAGNPAAREAALTRAALGYADALGDGKLDPARLRDPYSVPRPRFDAPAALNAALNDRREIAAWLGGLAPQDADYRALSEAFLAARRAARARAPIPAGRAIRPGGADARLPAIAAALAADGYLQLAPNQPPPGRYDAALGAAIRRLQEDYGLNGNGLIGEDTLAAINEGAIGRARALAVNLERRRWLAREAPATRIDVNTAAAVLTYWQEGQAVDRRRVVVGDPRHQTPELGSPITGLVANPTWTVPSSIQEEEIAPRGEAYMARNNMEWRNGRIVQRSGPTNSLGLVKFDMDNPHAIYLHDTPAQALFGQDDRHESHGCVRVQDALGFAALIADRQGVRERWEQARTRRDESDQPEEASVALPHPIPVRLMYQTAFVEGGRVRYRLDAYDWDEAVARALGYPARPARPARARNGDLGP